MRTRLQLPWLRLWLGLPRLFVRVVLLFVFLFVFLLLFVLVLVFVLLLLLLLLRVLDRRHYPTPGRRRSSVVGVRVRASWFMSSCSAAQKLQGSRGSVSGGATIQKARTRAGCRDSPSLPGRFARRSGFAAAY